MRGRDWHPDDTAISMIHGDGLDFFGKVDVIITDMPYGTTNCRWDTEIDLGRFWTMANNVCGGRVIAFGQTPFDKVLGVSNIQNLRYELIWEKTHPTGHLNANKCPLKAHENILVFGKMKYFPIKTTGHARKKSIADRSKLQSDCYGAQHGVTSYDSTERFPRSVLKFSSDKQKSNLHPTQKPLALMEWLVKTYTKEGETVLDPFMGSGTTGLACKNLKRLFVGIEKDKAYFDVACERIEKAGRI